MFYNRERELAELDRLWRGKKSGLIVLYGRRRVGKTALLRRWADKKPSLYWTATRTTTTRLLRDFSKKLQTFKNPEAAMPADFSYPTWEAALLDLTEYCRTRKTLVVLDEFPYAIEAEGALPSLLQKIWDDSFSKTDSTVCISGSRIGMIEAQILSSGGPLYGRASKVLWLDPLSLPALEKFLPRYSPTQLLEVYSVTGGVPLYVEIFDDSVPVLANIKRELASLASLLKTEPHFLIHEELKEPTRYVAILEAIGTGKRTQSEIATAAGIDKTHLMPYLHTLEGLKFIRRIVPVTENPKLSRKGNYVISDLFLKFYFRFMAPNQGILEAGREEKVVQEIAAQFNSYVGKNGFEEVCQKWLAGEARSNRLPFDPDAIGKFWDARVETDLAAINFKHRSLLIGEAKWQNKRCSLGVLEELNGKASYLSKKLGMHVNKMIFSKSGFEETLTQRARIENVRLVDLNRIWRDLNRP